MNALKLGKRKVQKMLMLTVLLFCFCTVFTGTTAMATGNNGAKTSSSSKKESNSDFNLNIDVIINESDRKPKKSPTKHENYNKNILTYCEKRNISKATIDYVGVKENNNCVVFEYRNELGEHLANKYRKIFANKTKILRRNSLFLILVSNPLLKQYPPARKK